MCQCSRELGKGCTMYFRDKKKSRKRAHARREGKAKSSIQNLLCCQKDTIGGKRYIGIIRGNYFKGNFSCFKVLKNVFHESKSNKSSRSRSCLIWCYFRVWTLNYLCSLCPWRGRNMSTLSFRSFLRCVLSFKPFLSMHLDHEPELWSEGAHCWQMPFCRLSEAAWDHHSLSLVPKLLAHNSSASDCPRRYD